MTESQNRSRVLDACRAAIGAAHVLTDEDVTAPYVTDWRKRYKGSALAVLRPTSTADVQKLVAIANEFDLALVTQGGNTGLVGGSVPLGRGDEILISMHRMNKIMSVDPLSDTMIVEAGVTLAEAQNAAEQVNRLFPLSLASEGTATIGGAIGTNAGGTAVLAYGNMRELVMGLEVVMPDGRVLDLMRRLRKDNTGYDLKDLIIGSEGTLGIVTRAVVKLFPLPKSRATALVAIDTPDDALKLFTEAKSKAAHGLTTFELMPRIGLDLVTRHIAGTRDPLSTRTEWIVLMEISSPASDGATILAENILADGLESGLVKDAVLANSLDQRDDFWRIRESLPEAQVREGASIKHDVSVPIGDVPVLITRVIADIEGIMPGVRPVPFGHMGDGNLHFNLQAPVGMDAEAFMAQADALHACVYGHVIALDGSVSAEHGIGQLKRQQLQDTKSPVALDLMRRVKEAFDPDHRLNPGKILFMDDERLK